MQIWILSKYVNALRDYRTDFDMSRLSVAGCLVTKCGDWRDNVTNALLGNRTNANQENCAFFSECF